MISMFFRSLIMSVDCYVLLAMTKDITARFKEDSFIF